MKQNLKITHKLNQSLKMSPQLQFAIKLLKLGRNDFKKELEKALIENPILEEEVNDKKRRDSQSQVSTLYSGGINRNQTENLLEKTVSNKTTLSQYILDQIDIFEKNENEQKIIHTIIGNLDKNGFLCITNEEIAKYSQTDIEDVNNTIEYIHTLDPPGVGARDTNESLLIQLDHLGFKNSLAANIVKNHLNKVANSKYKEIAKLESTTIEKIKLAVGIIKSLKLKPAAMFEEDSINYITPDVFIFKDEKGKFRVALNEEDLPKLTLSPEYLNISKNKTNNDSEKKYIKEKLKSANWLIRSIEQRKNTILKVTRSIIKYQNDFFDKGKEHLKPLKLKQIANDIEMHESTVSRISNNKYAHTPQGIFELKFFFNNSVNDTDGVSSSSVKEKIRSIISKENPKKPISDQKIVEMLKLDNIKIARRTIAKYRENLGIPPSSRRKIIKN